ncbi:GspE/PulE family protein [Francisella sp. SYW-9]|uniref:GspE/PulE family protein n=1 Tax=Francisella sp. SYW-9 TaxID=2610888 RepID=UPI00123CF093|nr:ATPase, T2SS/T4P/T4SS family [Francisella sp. SYW-9]
MKINKAIKGLLTKAPKATKKIVDSRFSLEDIKSINLLNQVEGITFESVIETGITKSGTINYIIFDAQYTDNQLRVCYFLINENISSNDFNRLMMRFEEIIKPYISYEIHKTSDSSIQSAKDQYKYKNAIQENRVDESQGLLHFNKLLEKSIRLGASDIHITAIGQTAIVKARVNGDLIELDRYTYSDMSRLISSAYNQLASVDSKDQSYSPNLTHETGIHKVINNKPYNLRFISKPIYPAGKKASFDVTMRLIDEDFHKPLETLGYSKAHLKILIKASGQPNGLVVLAGRVGSGKSLTIHSICTDYIHRATHAGVVTKKLVTFESPVEYKIVGAMQVEYKRDNSRTQEQEESYFNSQVQSLLRMDTNAVVLGEIRGKNVAQLAIQLVQSDNIVLTTVHAQSALKIFNRFHNLGMDKEVLTEPNFLLALVYQTLVKVPCSHCANTIDSDKGLKERLTKLIQKYQLDNSLLSNVKLINTKGCDHCNFGVVGRTLIAEIVEPTIAILAALREGNFNEAYRLWRKDGGITYQEHGLEKILKGQICPTAYEDKVCSLADEGFYAYIDKAFYPQVFKDVDWGISENE